MLTYIKILRPVNLLVIAVTQSLVFYILILPSLRGHDIDHTLSGYIFPLFVAVTLILAGTANIINDLKDHPIDQINKNQILVTTANKRNIEFYYYSLLVIGGILALYISIYIGKLGLVLIYPVAAILLYAYSTKFKSTPLAGNLIVSLFCALVPGIVWYAEYSAIHQLKNFDMVSGKALVFILSGFTLFSFISNFIRELVKDIEDVAGDKKGGINTFAVAFGEERTKVMVIFNLILMLIISASWLAIGWMNYFSNIEFYTSSILILVMPIIIIYLIYRAKEKSSYSMISKLLKTYMSMGLVALIILS